MYLAAFFVHFSFCSIHHIHYIVTIIQPTPDNNMKKLRFFLSLATLFTSLFAFNSCKKSYRCCYAGYCETIDQRDFNSKEAFDSYIKYLRNSGATCK